MSAAVNAVVRAPGLTPGGTAALRRPTSDAGRGAGGARRRNVETAGQLHHELDALAVADDGEVALAVDADLLPHLLEGELLGRTAVELDQHVAVREARLRARRGGRHAHDPERLVRQRILGDGP